MPVITTAGVVRIVGTGRTPLPVEFGEMEAVRKIVRSCCDAQPHPFLKVGDRVRIEKGPLAGIEGIVTGHKNQRLILSIALIQQSISIQLDDASAFSVVMSQKHQEICSRELVLTSGGTALKT